MTSVISTENEATEARPAEKAGESHKPSLSIFVLFKNMVSMVASNMGAMVLGFVISWLMARSLGDRVYGQYVFVLGITNIALAFADLGLAKVITREIAKDRAHAGMMLYTTTVLRLVAYIPTSLFCFALIFLLPELEGLEIVMVGLTITTLFTFLTELLRAPFVSFEKMELDLVTRVSERVLSLAALAALLALGFGLDEIVIALTLTTILGVGIALYYVLRLAPPATWKFDWNFGKMALAAGFPMGVSLLLINFYWRLDVLFLGIIRSKEEVAWFSISYSFILIVVSLSVSAASAFFPIFSRLAKEDKAMQLAVMTDALRYMLVASVGIAGGVFILAEPLILFVYGQEYAPAVSALQVLAFSLIFMLPTQLMFILLVSENKQRWILIANLIGGVLLLIFDPILISLYGIEGASLVNVGIETFQFCFYIYLTTIAIGFVGVRTVVPPLVAGALAFGFFLLSREIETPTILLNLVVTGGVYAVGLLGLGVVRRSDVTRLRTLMGR